MPYAIITGKKRKRVAEIQKSKGGADRLAKLLKRSNAKVKKITVTQAKRVDPQYSKGTKSVTFLSVRSKRPPLASKLGSKK